MKDKYDCIVIGAGPAGSMAAWVLAKNKHKVLLLEKHKEVGLPLCCAEAVSFRGLSICEQVNPAWIRSKIEKIALCPLRGKS